MAMISIKVPMIALLLHVWLVSLHLTTWVSQMLQQRYTAPEAAQANVDRKRFFANEMQKTVGEIYAGSRRIVDKTLIILRVFIFKQLFIRRFKTLRRFAAQIESMNQKLFSG